MATRVAICSITLLLFLFITLSRARDLHNSLSESPTRSKPQQYDTVPFNLNSIDHLPVVTLPDLRPINRHVHVLRPLPLEFPLSHRHVHVLRPLPLEFPLSHRHRRCRHGHRRQIPYGNDMILAKDRQIPYGNDMILANDSGSKDRRIPKRLSRFHGGEVMSFDRPHIHSHDRHEKSWFSKKIHEFLNLF
ncbi:unnamed protein product [Vicia faba]|uniref:Uncharacterized protein n=1 Tax=Vicia faba TaxID=3906 RepID=A0AAV0ZGT2_VICFA|nr:unnamed protein product [Vicia faba]